jgi:hypothetical protein
MLNTFCVYLSSSPLFPIHHLSSSGLLQKSNSFAYLTLRSLTPSIQPLPLLPRDSVVVPWYLQDKTLLLTLEFKVLYHLVPAVLSSLLFIALTWLFTFQTCRICLYSSECACFLFWKLHTHFSSLNCYFFKPPLLSKPLCLPPHLWNLMTLTLYHHLVHILGYLAYCNYLFMEVTIILCHNTHEERGSDSFIFICNAWM